MTIEHYYKKFIQKLQQIYNMQEAVIITDWVFEKLLENSRWQRIHSPATLLKPEQIEIMELALLKLLQHFPVQYLLGETIFYKLRLKLNEAVLIPRPETEELVYWIIKDVAATKNKLASILDIGTGSCCIAIALKKNLSEANITSIDISADALELAKENASNLHCNIQFKQIDFLNKAEWNALPKVDIIVSNPPYIPEKEINILATNVTRYEPHIALFVPDKSPQLFYEKIADFAKTNLNKDGIIYVETHEDYAVATATVFSTIFKDVIIKKDLLGKNRMIRATSFR